jgi:hypothetical protein
LPVDVLFFFIRSCARRYHVAAPNKFFEKHVTLFPSDPVNDERGILPAESCCGSSFQQKENMSHEESSRKLLCLITALFVTGMAGAEIYPVTVDTQRILASEHAKGINDPIFQDAAVKDSKAHDEITHCEWLDRVEWDTTADLWQVQAHISTSGEQPP